LNYTAFKELVTLPVLQNSPACLSQYCDDIFYVIWKNYFFLLCMLHLAGKQFNNLTYLKYQTGNNAPVPEMH